MKLVILLSVAALVACDYSAPQPETPSDAYSTPDKVESVEESSAPIEPGKSFFKFNSVYRGAFPPARLPPANFLSSSSFPSTFNYPLKAFSNLAASPQGILPPISQIIPPQISQIVPPIFGNKPSFPPQGFPTVPSQPFPSVPSVPSQGFPSVPSQGFPTVTNPLHSKFNFPYYSPLHSHAFPYTFPSSFPSAFPSTFPSSFPSTFPSTFSFPPSSFYPTKIQKQPSKTQTEPLSTSYGPPVSGPVDPEPAGPAESSAPFEPSSPVSFPYEPAAPDTPEPEAPHQPSQEYGVPSLN